MSEHNLGLITTGLTLGLVHVLAGPDHLSALAALSVGSSWRAFTLGFRWGIGHSTGLVVVAVVFISLKGELDLRTMGRYCDLLVGIFMIALGCYGVLGAIKTYKQKHNKRDRDLTTEESVIPFNRTKNTSSPHAPHSKDSTSLIQNNTLHKTSSSSSFEMISSGNNNKNNLTADTEGDEESLLNHHSHHTHHIESEHNSEHKTLSVLDSTESNNNSEKHTTHAHDHTDLDYDHHHNFVAEDCPWCPFIDMHDPYTQRIVSFSIGLLHGVAGPGGILGVLPAVEMQNIQSSFLYLTSFIVASTLSMGTFAALYGELTKRLGATAENVEFGLNIFSSAMSIIVGTIWFVLSLLGKLEGMFH